MSMQHTPSSARRPLVLAMFVALALVLAACAGSAAQAPAGDATGQNGGDGSLSGARAVASAAASSAPAAAGSPGEGTGSAVGAPVDDAKIIRTGTLDLEVSDVTTAVRTARDGIRGLGGYIGASQTGTEGDRAVASITYRVPVARWEEALDLLRGLNGLTSKVVNERTDAVEVTGQVVDLEARIGNLRSSETALQAIAASVTKITDILEVQARLTEVRGQIEQLDGQRKDLTDRAAFANLTASFRVPLVAVQVAQKGWDPATTVDEASASLIGVVQGLTTAGIWFAIVWLPVLLVLGLIVVAVIALLRRAGLIAPRRRAGTELPAA